MHLSKNCAAAVRRARAIAKDSGSAALLPEHLIVGLLEGENSATHFLRSVAVPPEDLRQELMAEIRKTASNSTPTKKAWRANSWNILMNKAASNARSGERMSISALDLLAAFDSLDGTIEYIFELCRVAYRKLRDFLAQLEEWAMCKPTAAFA